MAKTSTFSLQRILDFRKSMENKKAIDLKLSQVTLEKRQQQLSTLLKHKDAIMREDKSDEETPLRLNLTQLKVSNDYIVQLSEKIEQQDNQVKDSTELVRKNHDQLIEAAKDKKTVEILKKKFQENVRREKTLREAQKEDEAALRIHSQKLTRGNSL